MTPDDRQNARNDEALSWFVRLQECDDETLWTLHCDWLESDPANALAYARVESAWVSVETAEMKEAFQPGAHPAYPPIDIARETDATGLPEAPSSWRRRLIWAPIAVAASVATMITISLKVPQPSSSDITYRTDATHIRNVQLADGSQITLNRSTVLTARVDNAVRSVTLMSGEAAFDVRHNKAQPFVISVAGREVRVLGTLFGVTARDGTFAVAVSRGAVLVSTQSDSRKTLVLAAGKALIRLPGSMQDQISDIAPKNALAWKTGELSYATTTLAAVARDYERMLGHPVLVDPDIRDLPVSGIFQVRNGAAALTRQLQLALPIRIVETADGRRIMRKTSH